ncbi:MAG: hypothetical protein E7C05_17140 [Clostridium botulinum]|uniref:DUF4145 domain-containing protein n=1 Tax=Clostridium sporogenes TaxID=1509 RepID=UPI001C60EAEF|nr:DUF4145 domain-containing protein [Clostridium sporogenes]MBW5456583.1 hypothetical protein [Clostridium sporogenes]MDU2834270.1 hypothetical protein [Clostridium botulinum]
MKKRLVSILEYFEVEEDGTKFLHDFLRGHLYLEYILNVLIEKAIKSKHKNEFDTFYKKVCVLKDNKIIDDNMGKLLIAINKIRNKLAHQIDFKITFKMMFDLAVLSINAGVEYSDDGIFLNREYSEKSYGIEGIVYELFYNTFCQLLFDNEKYFIDNEILNYMS